MISNHILMNGFSKNYLSVTSWQQKTKPKPKQNKKNKPKQKPKKNKKLKK